MVGTALAVVAGALPSEFLDLALKLRIEMHMPIAPAVGLLLRTAGFFDMDTRAGSCAMDPEQARRCMMPAGGFCLLQEDAAVAAAQEFGDVIEANIVQRWQESSELEDWQTHLAGMR